MTKAASDESVLSAASRKLAAIAFLVVPSLALPAPIHFYQAPYGKKDTGIVRALDEDQQVVGADQIRPQTAYSLKNKTPDILMSVGDDGYSSKMDVASNNLSDWLAAKNDELYPDAMSVTESFDTDQFVPVNPRALGGVIAIAKKHPGTAFSIDGGADTTGTHERNSRLSRHRALSVKQILVDSGIPESSITAVWHGDTQPVDSNETKAGRSHNRRATVTADPLSGGNP